MKKILVLGDLSCKQDILYKEAKQVLGIDYKQIEFVGYQECKNFDSKLLNSSCAYTDIILGPAPHSVKNRGKYKSLYNKIKAEHPKTCNFWYTKKISKANFLNILNNIFNKDNHKKIFTIVIPYYDDTYETIQDTLDSIAKQEFDLKKVEVIVISDGAKKGIKKYIDKYKKNINSLHYYTKENGGWGSVINYVKSKKLINAKYFTILDSDDKLEKTCLNTFCQYLEKEPDILTSKFYFWKSQTNKKEKRKIYWLSKTKFFDNLNNSSFKTAYTFPLCKFYKTKNFYNSDFTLIEGKKFQDICLYYEMKKVSKTWQYINMFLGYYRCDRINSSSNESWTKQKILAWKEVIEYLSANDSGCVARFYLLNNQFIKKFKIFLKDKENIEQQKIKLKKKYEISFVPKKFNIITRLFLFFVVHFNKKIIKLY